MGNIKKGDLVEWTSGAAGITKRKVGTVTTVISAGEQPVPCNGIRESRMGQPRNHQSYVVKVGPLYYWPKVENLSVLRTNSAKPLSPKKKPVSKANKEESFIKEVIDTPKEKALVNYIGMALDMSGSMRGLTEAATIDFNRQLNTIKKASTETKQPTFFSVVHFGVQTYPLKVRLATASTQVEKVSDMLTRDYLTQGYTPLRDGVMTLIADMESQVVEEGIDASYLVMVITDGEENCSRTTAAEFSNKLKQLQSTDRWSFVFRLPPGFKKSFCQNNGVPEGNCIEWEATTKGVEKASILSEIGTTSYFTGRSQGSTQTRSFYANLSASDVKIKQTLTDLTSKVRILPVTKDIDIKAFAEYHGETYHTGYGYYQLTKSEDVQDYKEIIVQDKVDGKIYGGTESRDLLSLPHTGKIKLKPGVTGHYDIFIQSTSVNRKLIANTRMIYRAS